MMRWQRKLQLVDGHERSLSLSLHGGFGDGLDVGRAGEERRQLTMTSRFLVSTIG